MHAPSTVEPPPDTGKPDRQQRAADRYAARHTLWDESTLPRLRECGAVGVLPGGSVALKASGTVADGSRRGGFGGLSTCGSTWACPVCSAKIATHRAVELGAAVQSWQDQGGRVAMVTLTQRHDAGQALADLWDALGYAWGKVTSGRRWIAEQAEYGLDGWVRVVEATHGANGWHVHVHALLFLDSGDQAPDVRHLGAQLFTRWAKALVRKGMRAPLAGSGGLDVRLVSAGDAGVLGDYFTKSTYRVDAAGAGFEVAAGTMKRARMGNRTPFAILADVVTLGLADDLALWHEWEKGSHGRRQLTWSRGMRAKLLDVAELTDQEVAELDQGGAVVALVTADGWRRLCALRLDGALKLALQLDDSGFAALWLLDANGIDWHSPGLETKGRAA